MIARRTWLLYLAASLCVIALLYVRTLHFGFYWDDFDDLRPWTWGDLGRAFVGHYQPWAREGIYFYRPLTSVYLASATALFGLNATALHLIPLCVLTTASTLVGVLVERETTSRASGVSAAVLYAAHPLTAAAIGPWIANQYQGLLVIAVLCALLAWRRTASAGFRLTPTLAATIIAAGWLKEDGLLLGPALLSMHTARALITRDVPRPTARHAALVLGLFVSVIAWRWLWLPGQFGYGIPDLSAMFANLSRAWRYALLWQTGAAPLSWILTIVKAVWLGVVCWLLVRRRAWPVTRLAVTGLAMMAMMNLPLAFVSSENRWHVMGLCTVLITSAAIGAVRTPVRWIVLAMTVVLCAGAAWERISVFAPCSADSLTHYRWAMTWPELPAPMHQWLSTRDAACASGQFDHFTVPMRDMRWGQR